MISIIHRILLLLQTLSLPAPRGYVSDFAGILDSASIQKMTAVIEDLRAKTGGDIAVVTFPDLHGRAASDVALAIGRQWGVGQKGNPGDPARNRGIVLLLVPRKNHVPGTGSFWIATGNGSEGFVTDAAAGRIRDAVMSQLSSEDYNDAAVQATELIAQRFAGEFHVTLDHSIGPRRPIDLPGQAVNPGVIVAGMVIVLVIAIAILGALGRGGRGSLMSWLVLAAMQSRRNRGGWGGWGGGGGGGFGGFGGFGGGGGGGFGGFGGGGGFSGGGAGGSF